MSDPTPEQLLQELASLSARLEAIEATQAQDAARRLALSAQIGDALRAAREATTADRPYQVIGVLMVALMACETYLSGDVGVA